MLESKKGDVSIKMIDNVYRIDMNKQSMIMSKKGFVNLAIAVLKMIDIMARLETKNKE